MITQAHPAGRAFDDTSKPLGYDLLDRTLELHDLELLANRTKGVAVLRKAEEFLYSGNPSAHEPGGIHRALELASARVGIRYDEYVAIMKSDPELQELQKLVIDDALSR
ncbi:MAG TPA: hypothetical protein VIF62_13005 [Labilithrix sp.]